jgi:hypothetical protein
MPISTRTGRLAVSKRVSSTRVSSRNPGQRGRQGNRLSPLLPSGAGQNARAAVKPAPASTIRSTLALPSLSPAVPNVIPWWARRTEGETTQSSLPDIASKLLDLGVLRSSDWTGALENSVASGLSRWMESMDGKDSLKCFSLWCELFSDANAEPVGLHSASWCNAFIGMPVDHGGFGIVCHEMEDIYPMTCGEAVLEIEELHKGAGFAILGLLDEFNAITGLTIATPGWLFSAAHWSGTFTRGDFTQADFHEIVPLEATDSKYGRSQKNRIHRAHEIAQMGAGLGVQRCLSAAVDLIDKCDEARRHARCETKGESRLAGGLGHRCWTYMDQDWPSVLMRWSNSDAFCRIFDDYVESSHEAGVTPVIGYEDATAVLLSARFFDARLPNRHPASLASAIRAIALINDLVVRADRLVAAMSEMSEPIRLEVAA